jgi:hypothetical protein
MMLIMGEGGPTSLPEACALLRASAARVEPARAALAGTTRACAFRIWRSRTPIG